ncbi:MAG: Smr/MutS family protein [Myxococcales bacterium]|nr:Smr/MutS family protein [Myxococcales bacterium]
MELDLHGMTVDEALAFFVRRYNEEVRTGRRAPLHVIHGYSSTGDAGRTIKRELHRLLHRHRDRLTYICGEKIDGNPGYTIVEPRGTLPTALDRLQQDIRQFCETGKTKEKIVRKFLRKNDEPTILTALDALVKDKLLRVETKGGIRVYCRE